MEPEPPAVRVVVPETLVLPMVMLALEAGVVVRLRVAAVRVPVVEREPPAAESVTDRVPVPTLEVWTVVEAVSVTAVVPEVAVALIKPALVAEIVAPPLAVTKARVPVPTLVAAVWEMEPEPAAVSVVVPEMFVLPIVMLPLEPAVAVRFNVPPVMVPAVLMVPPAAESETVSVPEPTLDACTVVEAVSAMEVVPDVAVAFKKPALVLEIVAPPVPDLSDRVPAPTFVAAV
jgi:hypothetical protein